MAQHLLTRRNFAFLFIWRTWALCCMKIDMRWMGTEEKRFHSIHHIFIIYIIYKYIYIYIYIYAIYTIYLCMNIDTAYTIFEENIHINIETIYSSYKWPPFTSTPRARGEFYSALPALFLPMVVPIDMHRYMYIILLYIYGMTKL